MDGGYPVKWGEKTLYAHEATVGDKEAFVAWAKKWEAKEQIAMLADWPHILTPTLAGIPPLIFWGDAGMSPLCAKIIQCLEGERQYNRLLFGASAKQLSDDDLQKMIDSKRNEQAIANAKLDAAGQTPEDGTYPPANDYYTAMAGIRENQDPKA